MGKPFSSIGMLLLSLLLVVGASVPAFAQSPASKLEQLVRAKGTPFKINQVSSGFLGLGNTPVSCLQHPVTAANGDWHSINLVSDHTIVLMFMPASKTYAIYWRLTPAGGIDRTVYGTIGKGAEQSGVPNSRYAKQFQAELQFWSRQTP